MNEEEKQLIDLVAEKAAERAVNKVFERYGIEADHLIHLKDSYERRKRTETITQKTVLVAALVAILGFTVAGFFLEVSDNVKEVVKR